MKIAGLQKVTLLDYPDKVACIIFTQGCPFACEYCHNAEIIDLDTPGTVSEEELFAYLDLRAKILDGIVISGGEPLIQKDLKEFIQSIKKKYPNLLVKLDTTGMNSKLLQELIDLRLIDYVAMDLKNSLTKYELTLRHGVKLEEIKKSIEILLAAPIEVEFRTTIVKGLHNEEDLRSILELVGTKRPYYLQNFKDSESVPNHKLQSFTNVELQTFMNKYSKQYPNLKIRA
ncbi:MAG: anaerobic ribonucleoside-triphosphate reductase activating protein [Bacilli bacterium]|nr:anaerobic ribonucleoside-triphosphate reductase activating protein [Bacilli bacterium]